MLKLDELPSLIVLLPTDSAVTDIHCTYFLLIICVLCTHGNGGRKDSVFTRYCLSACLSTWYPKTDAARITKLDTQMFHDRSWKPFTVGSKGQRSRSRSTKKFVSIFRRNAILPLGAYISYAGFSRCKPCLRHQVFPASLSGWCCCRPPVFLGVGFFCSQPAAKTLPAWIIALFWMRVASSLLCWNLDNIREGNSSQAPFL